MLVTRYFADTFPTWEAVYQSRTLYSTIYQERLRAAIRLVQTLPLAPGSAALDLGCGPGFGSIALARLGLLVHAADTLDKMVDLTLQRAAAEGLRVSGSVADIHALSFADATFDLIFVVGVSEWLDSLEAPLAEVARVLKPGGHLVLSADNSWALSCLLDPLQNPMIVPIKRALGAALRRVHKRPRALRTHAYSMFDLSAALHAAGLTKVAGSTLGFGPFSFCNQALLPDRVGHFIHRRLEALARADRSLLGLAGFVHVVAARRPTAR